MLDIGCGTQPYRQLLTSGPSRVSKYIGLDLDGENYGGENAPTPDLRWDGNLIPLENDSVDTAFSTEVLEHCPNPQGVLTEIHRVLKPGGGLFLTVPFLWPLHDTPHDFYRYTPFGLKHLLERADFRESSIEALGGWDASLGQMLGLWVSRRPISSKQARRIRSVFAFLSLPLLKYLYRKDRKPDSFLANPMITGFSCQARKARFSDPAFPAGRD